MNSCKLNFINFVAEKGRASFARLFPGYEAQVEKWQQRKKWRTDNYRFGCTLWWAAFHDGNIAERDSCILWLQTELIAQNCEEEGERK